MRKHNFPIQVPRQPTLTTCGPTCLQAVYQYFGDKIDLDQVIDEIETTESGGTLAVTLACHALERDYDARIFTYNLQLFDPSWFKDGQPEDIEKRVQKQLEAKASPRMEEATNAYLKFFQLGGKLEFKELTDGLLRGFLDQGVPILTGLSATYLYGCARELNDAYDDVGGEPAGHFVVLSGYDDNKGTVRIGDPMHDNPRYSRQYYDVSMDRLKTSILLGIVTYDANLLVIQPRSK